MRVVQLSRGAGAIVTCALVAASCSFGGTADEESADEVAGPAVFDSNDSEATPRPSSGCDSESAVAEEDVVSSTLKSDGVERAYLVNVPGDYTGADPLDLVFQFHGAFSTKEQQMANTDFASAAPEALIVAPDALGTPTAWSPLLPSGADDLLFFEDLFAEIERDWCIDLDRVFASGMSSGGWMSTAVTCAHPEIIKALGPATAVVYADGLCGDAAPIPIVYFHGTEDEVVPFAGRNPGPNGEASPDGAEPTMQRWAIHNGCDEAPVDSELGADVIHRVWQNCDATTEFYIVNGGGHTWPGATTDVEALGITTHTISASELVWELFDSIGRSDG